MQRTLLVVVAAISLVVSACVGAPQTNRGRPGATSSTAPEVTPLPPDVTAWDVRALRLDPGLTDLMVTPDSGGTLHAVFKRAWTSSTESVYRQSPVHGGAWDATLALDGTGARLAGGGDDRYILLSQADACRDAPGVLHNAKRGARQAWSKVTCISRTDRSTQPTIVAAGRAVYVAWMEPDDGAVIVQASRDGGRTFAKTILGRLGTPVEPDDARVSIAAEASDVVASWQASGGVTLRWSTDTGKTWGAPLEWPSLPSGGVDVRDGRVLVIAGTPVRGAWELHLDDPTPKRIEAPWIDEDDARVPQFVIGPNGSLGAFTAPTGPSRMTAAPSDARVATWRTTADQGATWSPAAVVPIDCDVADTARLVSVAWSNVGEIDAIVQTDDAIFITMRP